MKQLAAALLIAYALARVAAELRQITRGVATIAQIIAASELRALAETEAPITLVGRFPGQGHPERN